MGSAVEGGCPCSGVSTPASVQLRALADLTRRQPAYTCAHCCPCTSSKLARPRGSNQSISSRIPSSSPSSTAPSRPSSDSNGSHRRPPRRCPAPCAAPGFHPADPTLLLKMGGGRKGRKGGPTAATQHAARTRSGNPVTLMKPCARARAHPRPCAAAAHLRRVLDLSKVQGQLA